MDWPRELKKLNQPGADFGAVEQAISPRPKWYDVRHWQIGEWGSLASLIGLGLWLSEKAYQAGSRSVIPPVRRKR